MLDNQQIKADKRLFATATPRVYRASLKKAAEGVGVEVIDMSDENSFGKRFHMGQRQYKDKMDPDRRQRLEGLPGWSWDPLEEAWEEGLAPPRRVCR